MFALVEVLSCQEARQAVVSDLRISTQQHQQQQHHHGSSIAAAVTAARHSLLRIMFAIMIPFSLPLQQYDKGLSYRNETFSIDRQWYWRHAVKFLPGGSTLQSDVGWGLYMHECRHVTYVVFSKSITQTCTVPHSFCGVFNTIKLFKNCAEWNLIQSLI